MQHYYRPDYSNCLTVINREVVAVLKEDKGNEDRPELLNGTEIPDGPMWDPFSVYIDIISDNEAAVSFCTTSPPSVAWMEKVVAAHPKGSYALLVYASGGICIKAIKYVDGEQVPHQEYDDE